MENKFMATIIDVESFQVNWRSGVYSSQKEALQALKDFYKRNNSFWSAWLFNRFSRAFITSIQDGSKNVVWSTNRNQNPEFIEEILGYHESNASRLRLHKIRNLKKQK